MRHLYKPDHIDIPMNVEQKYKINKTFWTPISSDQTIHSPYATRVKVLTHLLIKLCYPLAIFKSRH